MDVVLVHEYEVLKCAEVQRHCSAGVRSVSLDEFANDESFYQTNCVTKAVMIEHVCALTMGTRPEGRFRTDAMQRCLWHRPEGPNIAQPHACLSVAMQRQAGAPRVGCGKSH